MENKDFLINGLSSAQVEESRKKHGSNLLDPPKRTPWWRLLLEKFDDPIIRILLVAAAIAVIVGFFQGNFVEGIGIILAVLLATLMAFFNEYRAGLEFDILNKVSDQQPVKVIRDGGVTSVPIAQVVVGDHVIVDTGDEIPADGKIISSISLGVNESSLTGEPMVYKNAQAEQGEQKHTYPSNMLYRGTTVLEGSANYVVTAVGNATEIGKTAREATMELHQQTPLSKQLEKLSKFIGVIGFSVAFIAFWSLLLFDVIQGKIVLTSTNWFSLFAVLLPAVVMITRIWLPVVYDLLRFLNKHLEYPKILTQNFFKSSAKLLLGSIALFAIFYGIGLLLLRVNLFSAEAWFSLSTLNEIMLFVLVAITLIVVAVPEGLAMSVTLSLAYSMRKMTATNNLVRRMHATETMGATTVICTDKTGTLTQNRMQVVDVSFFAGNPSNHKELKLLAAISTGVNSKAYIDVLHGNSEPLGNPTDAALLLWLNGLGENYDDYRLDFSISARIPFSSETKYMATAGTTPKLPKSVILIKGAPEIVRSMCTQYYGENGETPIENLEASRFEDKVLALQQAAKRTIAFAFKFVDEAPEQLDKTHLQDMVLLGFMGIADPIREDVVFAVNECRGAGVGVKVVTGDILGTAQEICRQIGLYKDGDGQVFISGEEFEKLSADEAKQIIPQLLIMYRARPSDKLKLVSLLQEMGEVVAVTGDGTNDAPALNRADVGLAMGSGSSVAKEASDIILLDDSFFSIVNAIRWGRSLYQNIQRFLVFQLTINLLAMAIVLFGPLVGVALPLTVIQMLWVNLIMDTFAALALATEPPNQEVMKNKPRSSSDFIITRSMRIYITTGAIMFFIVLMALLKILSEPQGISRESLTIFFNVFVMLQFWNLFNVKAMGTGQSIFKGLKKNVSYLFMASIILMGQVLIVQYGGDFFRTKGLSLPVWLIIFFSTSIVLWIGEAYRLIGRKKAKSRKK